jgi:hypothetical protein
MGVEWDTDTSAIADFIVIALFLLLRPGKYTGTYSDDSTLKLQDVSLYIQGRCLEILTALDS